MHRLDDYPRSFSEGCAYHAIPVGMEITRRVAGDVGDASHEVEDIRNREERATNQLKLHVSGQSIPVRGTKRSTNNSNRTIPSFFI